MKLTALLIDLSGTLHIGDEPTKGAVRSLQRLRDANFPFRFCSNTTKESTASLLGRLRSIGFEAKEEELYTSLNACKKYVEEHKLKPYCILSDSAMEDFKHLTSHPIEESDSVVVGLAPERLDYEHLNTAFGILSREPLKEGHKPDPSSPRTLLATHTSTYYRPSSASPLSLGPGPFVHALSTSTTPPTPINTLGKPSVSFFKTTVASLSLPSASSSSSSSSEGKSEPEYSAIGIVGDDWKNDLGGGARELGLRRCLVRTGKWREGDLEKAREGEDGGVKGEVTEWENFQELVEEILKG